jgi:predicted transcriptional regulator of viral defense system
MIAFAHKLAAASPEPDHDRLFEVAEGQAGYFTAAQAAAAGFNPSLLSYHTKRGQFERVRPGVYRLKRFPSSPYEDLFVAWLWTGPEAVISHDSALALYDLSDLLPAETHVTVPRTASRRRAGLRLHTNRLQPGDVTRYAGVPVTTAARTIADVASAGLADELVLQAIHEALQRGLATPAGLRAAAAARSGRAFRLTEQALAAETT